MSRPRRPAPNEPHLQLFSCATLFFALAACSSSGSSTDASAGVAVVDNATNAVVKTIATTNNFTALAANGTTKKVYGAEGLWVSDASLFPSPIGVNPQETIMALSTRNAERLIETRLGTQLP